MSVSTSNLTYCISLIPWAMVSIYILEVLMSASALTVGPSVGLSQLPFPQDDHTTWPSRDKKSLPTELGMRHMGNRSGRASILAGQGKQADVGSNTCMVQDGGSHWCQILLILSLSGRAVSHCPGISH